MHYRAMQNNSPFPLSVLEVRLLARFGDDDLHPAGGIPPIIQSTLSNAGE